MRERIKRTAGWVVSLFWLSAIALSQNAPPPKTLVLAGHPDGVAVVEMNGHSYITLESLSQLTGGTLAFKANQITLTLPEGTSTPPPSAPSQGLSKGFMSASIEEEALIREWRSALANAVQNGYPVTEDWISGYRGRAAEGLRLVSMTATTSSDQSALQMLNSELGIMESLSDKYVAANKSLTYMGPDSLSSDPLYQRVLDCKNALAAIWSSGQFQDSGGCQ
jgi:hypothetical protein